MTSKEIAEKTLAILRDIGARIGRFEKECKMIPGYLSRTVNEKRKITLDSASRIANALGFTLEEYLAYDVKKQKLQSEIDKRKAELEKLEEELDEINNTR